MKRIPPSVRMREEVEQLLRGDAVEGAPPEIPMRGFVRTLARYILQVSIEQEATAFWGREHYGRGQRRREGWRNGYEPKGVQSEAGLLELAVPQLRATAERFRPRLVERLGHRSVDLDGLVRGMYVRGLSTQDIKDLYGEQFGESRLTKSTVSRITQQLNGEFETWRKRDLSDLNVVYLFLDGQYHAARQGTDEKEGVLSAYALLEDGRPVLLPDHAERDVVHTPSVVYVNGRSAFVGSMVEVLLEQDPNLPVVRFFKRHFGIGRRRSLGQRLLSLHQAVILQKDAAFQDIQGTDRRGRLAGQDLVEPFDICLSQLQRFHQAPSQEGDQDLVDRPVNSREENTA